MVSGRAPKEPPQGILRRSKGPGNPREALRDACFGNATRPTIAPNREYLDPGGLFVRHRVRCLLSHFAGTGMCELSPVSRFDRVLRLGGTTGGCRRMSLPGALNPRLQSQVL
jgi:hypothetical protein